MKSQRKLPIGIQDFETIRSENYIYVDKTQYVWNLVENGQRYFLSRPRRFGKSLFVSTLSAYFRGKKELFQGLDIDKLENGRGKNAWLEYPVIHFSLSGGRYLEQDGLEQTLRRTLAQTEKEYGIDGGTYDLPNQFANDIEQLFEKTGRKVVVLVDEYDKPLLETMTVNEQQEEANRQLYKAFFSILKDEDAYLKFVFFTGVTKFSKISIFSDLNQLDDISLRDQVSAICGITQEELLANFRPEITSLSRTQDMTEAECLKELARMYDGYHFSRQGEGVYNPFSLLKAFASGDFGSYWFETGTPTFLIRKLRSSRFTAEQFTNGVEAKEADLKNYRTDNPDPIPLFYQSGYLTICGYDKEFRIYYLKFPNDEVKYGFLDSLVPLVLGEQDAEHPLSSRDMILDLRKGDIRSFMTRLEALFASIPYYEGKQPDYEQEWRNEVFLIFVMLGENARSEVHSSAGRADCVVETGEYIYLFEFKLNKSAEEALRQIDENDYAVPYLASARKLVKVGVNFSSDKRNINDWISA